MICLFEIFGSFNDITKHIDLELLNLLALSNECIDGIYPVGFKVANEPRLPCLVVGDIRLGGSLILIEYLIERYHKAAKNSELYLSTLEEKSQIKMLTLNFNDTIMPLIFHANNAGEESKIIEHIAKFHESLNPVNFLKLPLTFSLKKV